MPKTEEEKRAFLNESALVREIYPVTKGVSYGNGCYEFIRTAKHISNAHRPPRGAIRKMSKKSLIRLMFIMQCTQVHLGSMLTLTYPKHYPENGEIVKEDINVMAQKMRRRGWSYVWFLEFQVRGAPHVHYMLEPDTITPKMRADVGIQWTERIAMSKWYLEKCPDGDYLKEVIKMLKFNCHESTFELLREHDGAKKYAAKYAAKEKQKKVPKRYKNVGRFWGASQDIKPDGIEFDVTEEDVEQWLASNGHPALAWELVPRHIWGLGKMIIEEKAWAE